MGILHRRVVIDLLQVFIGVATALTFMLVVVGVIGEASRRGLGPEQIQKILPYVAPSLLPFTIPATFLLTVCVVYGRMAGDQEITALKSAGINVLEVLLPAFILGAVLSVGTLLLTDLFVPWARARIENIILTEMEEIFLELLRSQGQYHDPTRGLAVTARRVDGQRLIDPTFRYVLPGGKSALIMAEEATLKFDLEHRQVLLRLTEGYMKIPGETEVRFRREEERAFPLPIESQGPLPPREMAIQSLRQEIAQRTTEYDRLLERRAIETALALSTGRFDRLVPDLRDRTWQELDRHVERRQKLTTEIHNRVALACGCFFFALVGSPFAILQGKRQFLTSFFLCFAPILLLYYPTVLLTMNLGREGFINPAWGVWVGNTGLAIAGAVILRRVLRH
jgi:lipopolysaccharide export system permease protein